MSATITYTLVIYQANGSTPLVTITSIRGGTNPYLSSAPTGDGASFDPRTGESLAGAYTGRIADWPTVNMQRVLTSRLQGSTFGEQLGWRRAKLSYQVNGGTAIVMIFGVITSLRLIDAMTWEFTIGDPMRAQGGFKVFDAAPDTLIMDYYAAWPNRGCVFGGPVIGGFRGIEDLGGWTMRVAEVRSAGTSIERYRLAPINVYGPPAWNRNANIQDVAEPINQAVQQIRNPSGPSNYWGDAAGNFDTIQDAQLKSFWSGLVYIIDETTPYRPGVQFTGSGYDQDDPDCLVRAGEGTGNGSRGSGAQFGIFCTKDNHPALTLDQIVTVRCLTIMPSEISPIYLDEHPLTLDAQLWTLAGLPYDTAALDAVTDNQAIGAGLRQALRITDVEELGTFVTRTTAVPFGIGIRANDAGELTPFISRQIRPTLPSITITAADVVQGSVTPVYDLDASQGLREVTVTMPVFSPGGVQGSLQVVDHVVEDTRIKTSYNTDPDALPFGSQDVEIPGEIHSEGSAANIPDFVGSIATDLFDRFGRGTLSMEMTLIRGGVGDTLYLGDTAIIELPQIPNGNYRLGDNPAISGRVMQVVRRTVLPEGFAVRVMDSGPNAQPLTTKPVITIAASASLPRTVATITITNAAALNALGYGVRIQWAVIPSGTPASADYVTALELPRGAIPTGAITLPNVVAGSKVYVRGRSEYFAELPSTYSTPVSVTLSSVDDPTALSATPNAVDGSECTIDWTIGANAGADLTDIFIRTQGAPFSDAVKVGTLLPGSTRFLMSDLTPSALYTATVQHRDPTTGDVSDPVDVNFTADSTTYVLFAPVLPAGFAGSLDPFTGQPIYDGVYGIAVVAAERPGFVQAEEAVETAPGSGTYGAYAITGRVPSVQGTWSIVASTAPQDGLRRRMKAYHIGTGQGTSSATAVVRVLPWVPLALPPLPTELIIEVNALAPSIPTSRFAFEAIAIDAFGGTPDIGIKALAGGTTIDSGKAVGVYDPTPESWELILPTVQDGPASVTLEAQLGDRVASLTFVIPVETILGGAQGTVSIDVDGTWGFTADAAPTAMSFKWLADTAGYPTDLDTDATGTGVDAPGVFTVTAGGVLVFGETIYITILPYTEAGYTGVMGPSIHIRGSYQSYSATKTANYSAASLLTTVPVGSDIYFEMNGGELRAFFPSAVSLWQVSAFAFIPQAEGCTLIEVTAAINSYNSSAIFFDRIDDTGGVSGLGNDTAAGSGWQTLNIGLSDSTIGAKYRFDAELVGGNDIDPGDGIAGFTVVWEMPQPDASL